METNLESFDHTIEDVDLDLSWSIYVNSPDENPFESAQVAITKGHCDLCI